MNFKFGSVVFPGAPFRFNYEVDHSGWTRDGVLDQICVLAEKYVKNTTRVEMLSKTNERSNRIMTCLEKVLHTFTSWIGKRKP